MARNILKPGNKMRVLERLTGTRTGPIVSHPTNTALMILRR